MLQRPRPATCRCMSAVATSASVLAPQPMKRPAPTMICQAASASAPPGQGQEHVGQDAQPEPGSRRSRRSGRRLRPDGQVLQEAVVTVDTVQQPAAIEASDARLVQELAVQEAEVELSVDDVVQAQYEVPSEALLDEEDEAEEEAGLWSGGRPQEGAATASPDTISRPAAVLLELIAAAAGSDLDAKIAQFADDIDQELLDLLQARIDITAQVNDGMADHLRELYGVLSVVHERASASPALRLLDDVLDLLGDDVTDAQAYAGRRLAVLSRLREAFAGGAAAGVDIFAAAAALAESAPLAAAELASETVDAREFISEVTEVLQNTRATQAALAEDLERARRELEYVQKHKPELLAEPKGIQFQAQVKHAAQVHMLRSVTLSQLQDVLSLARQAASSPLPGSRMLDIEDDEDEV